jgi:hypothetical protein
MVDAMMTPMTPEGVHVRSSVGRLPVLVDDYARRVVPAVLEQHPRGSVASPLGVWLLLAACAGAAEGPERASLEEALGCSGVSAGRMLADFMAAPPPALKAAVAVWVSARDATDALADWVRGLPPSVESGFMPTQAEADAWAARETLGLIKWFPVAIDELTRVVLASALATRVSWQVPFGVVPARAQLGPGSPWRGRVKRLLWDGLGRGGERAMIARTAAAGVVAVHCAVAREELTVVSVSADPGVERAAVLTAAHEVASAAVAAPDEWSTLACSLYDLPLGSGHSWEISEEQVPSYVKEAPLERIAGAALPAWSVRGDLNLLGSVRFGTRPALETLRRLIGPRPDDECQAVQTAVASFTRYGFEAAAVTAMAVRASAARVPVARTLQRSAVLRFDHPYAAVAIAGRPPSPGRASSPCTSPGQPSGFPGLPLFSVWVHEPQEPEDRPPSA